MRSAPSRLVPQPFLPDGLRAVPSSPPSFILPVIPRPSEEASATAAHASLMAEDVLLLAITLRHPFLAPPLPAAIVVPTNLRAASPLAIALYKVRSRSHSPLYY